jgi:Glyoxalase/Bleomycin resistance protein/Dioxygenase superfamily
MSRYFGPIVQHGYVMPDIDAAMRYWTETLGIGPFFVARSLVVENMVLRGKQGPAQMHIALGHSGGVQIELIQPTGGKSLYQEFLDEGNVGTHHVAYLTTDYLGSARLAEAQGLISLMTGQFGDIRFAYFETDELRSLPLVELIDAAGSFGMLQKKVADASIGWSGADPIRDFAILA